jgi:hypothetical protein
MIDKERIKENLIFQAKELIKKIRWIKTTSKQYKDVPHEWCSIKTQKDEKDLMRILEGLIENYGYVGYFYNTPFKYFDIDNYQYWCYDIIINRVKKEFSITKDTPNRIKTKKDIELKKWL